MELLFDSLCFTVTDLFGDNTYETFLKPETLLFMWVPSNR